jgi:hypothetical protein
MEITIPAKFKKQGFKPVKKCKEILVSARARHGFFRFEAIAP